MPAHSEGKRPPSGGHLFLILLLLVQFFSVAARSSQPQNKFGLNKPNRATNKIVIATLVAPHLIPATARGTAIADSSFASRYTRRTTLISTAAAVGYQVYKHQDSVKYTAKQYIGHPSYWITSLITWWRGETSSNFRRSAPVVFELPPAPVQPNPPFSLKANETLLASGRLPIVLDLNHDLFVFSMTHYRSTFLSTSVPPPSHSNSWAVGSPSPWPPCPTSATTGNNRSQTGSSSGGSGSSGSESRGYYRGAEGSTNGRARVRPSFKGKEKAAPEDSDESDEEDQEETRPEDQDNHQIKEEDIESDSLLGERPTYDQRLPSTNENPNLRLARVLAENIQLARVRGLSRSASQVPEFPRPVRRSSRPTRTSLPRRPSSLRMATTYLPDYHTPGSAPREGEIDVLIPVDFNDDSSTSDLEDDDVVRTATWLRNARPSPSLGRYVRARAPEPESPTPPARGDIPRPEDSDSEPENEPPGPDDSDPDPEDEPPAGSEPDDGDPEGPSPPQDSGLGPHLPGPWGIVLWWIILLILVIHVILNPTSVGPVRHFNGHTVRPFKLDIIRTMLNQASPSLYPFRYTTSETLMTALGDANRQSPFPSASPTVRSPTSTSTATHYEPILIPRSQWSGWEPIFEISSTSAPKQSPSMSADPTGSRSNVSGSSPAPGAAAEPTVYNIIKPGSTIRTSIDTEAHTTIFADLGPLVHECIRSACEDATPIAIIGVIHHSTSTVSFPSLWSTLKATFFGLPEPIAEYFDFGTLPNEWSIVYDCQPLRYLESAALLSVRGLANVWNALSAKCDSVLRILDHSGRRVIKAVDSYTVLLLVVWVSSAFWCLASTDEEDLVRILKEVCIRRLGMRLRVDEPRLEQRERMMETKARRSGEGKGRRRGGTYYSKEHSVRRSKSRAQRLSTMRRSRLASALSRAADTLPSGELEVDFSHAHSSSWQKSPMFSVPVMDSSGDTELPSDFYNDSMSCIWNPQLGRELRQLEKTDDVHWLTDENDGEDGNRSSEGEQGYWGVVDTSVYANLTEDLEVEYDDDDPFNPNLRDTRLTTWPLPSKVSHFGSCLCLSSNRPGFVVLQ
ncbi:hypothetical protein CC2G_012775 [Coprinopsis cinerea AmutBmut pab1-1]|nr:hypothetical protein CC2G_012775 [Coprinopsis cinerea AmutBmut pab1-1]